MNDKNLHDKIDALTLEMEDLAGELQAVETRVDHSLGVITTILRAIANQLNVPLDDLHSQNQVVVDGVREVVDEAELFEAARDLILEYRKVSTAFLQRKLRIGYSRAARLIDILEARGVIGPADGARPRAILNVPNDAE